MTIVPIVYREVTLMNKKIAFRLFVRTRSLFLALCCWVMVAGCSPTTTSESTDFGRFEGEVVAVWSPNGRDMTLREPFTYVDGNDRVWTAPEGSTVNGASIPYAFWSFIGGPFEGRYRNASVVHDVGCETMTDSWEDVHKMFYDACRCGGVEETEAKMLYYAVYHFGPRWEPMADGAGNTQLARLDPVPPTMEEIGELATFVAQENPTAETIRKHDRHKLHRSGQRSKGSQSSTSDFAHRWENQQTNKRRGRRPGPRELSTETEEQVIAVVRNHIVSQAGEERPATYTVTAQRGGYRVDVQFVHEETDGQVAADLGGNSVAFVTGNGQLVQYFNR